MLLFFLCFYTRAVWQETREHVTYTHTIAEIRPYILFDSFSNNFDFSLSHSRSHPFDIIRIFLCSCFILFYMPVCCQRAFATTIFFVISCFFCSLFDFSSFFFLLLHSSFAIFHSFRFFFILNFTWNIKQQTLIDLSPLKLFSFEG